MPPVDADAYFDGPVEPIPAIQQELLQDRLGHIVVPAFVSGNDEAVLQYSGQIQAAVQSLDAQGACGWIVDLRYNDGGNGFAMLAGLAPLLGDGVYGYHTDTNGNPQEWRYEAGKMYLGEILVVELPDPYQIQSSGAAIAVLTSELTTSAGELVAIAFRGWPNTRSFGQETLGRTTGPQGFFLSDGAILGISVAYFTDHTGQVYTNGIMPDEYIFEEKGPLFRDRSVPPQAIDWLLSQPACAGQ
jgi:C-terminal processing protease CtpA/Prc